MRVGRGAVVVTAMVVTLLGLLTPLGQASTAHRQIVNGRFALGDSVMLGAAHQLRHRGFTVDAIESRQVYDGVDALRHRKAIGRLPRDVVVALGTNGTMSRGQCSTLHRIVGPHRTMFLVTVRAPRSWTRGDNRVMHWCARHFANTTLIDWHGRSAGHSSYFYGDGIHLTPRGARAYARLIGQAVAGR